MRIFLIEIFFVVDQIASYKVRPRHGLTQLRVTTQSTRQVSVNRNTMYVLSRVHSRRTELTCTKLTQLGLHDVSVTKLIGCRAAVRALQSANSAPVRELHFSSVQFVCCEHGSCYSAPGKGAKYCDERVCLSVCVCLFVCPRSYLGNYMYTVRSSPNFCLCCIWPWLGPHLAA